MSSWLTTARIKHGDKVFFPGEVLTDEDLDARSAGTLLGRRMIVPVPADFTPPGRPQVSEPETPPEPPTAPTEEQLRGEITKLSDEEIDGALESYEVAVAPEATRVDKEAALLAYAQSHPEMFEEPEGDEEDSQTGVGSTDAESERTQPSAPPTADELEEMKRGDLDDYARENGVEDPDKLPNKGAVIEAVLAARENS